jgi:hypothetical protein
MATFATDLGERVDVAPGGVNDFGAYEEDDPVTWEIPASPRKTIRQQEVR